MKKILLVIGALFVAWHMPRAWTWLGHYTSTNCLHGLHSECRRTCKVCNARCLCGCHK